MMDVFRLLIGFLRDLTRSRAELEAEILVLRQQLSVLRRRSPGRVRISRLERMVIGLICKVWPGLLNSIVVVRPETVVRWHRSGFRSYWRWKSRNRGGRPKIDADIRALIRQISKENPLWGAPRIHGELLKLGIDVCQSTVAKYMVRGPRRSGQSWKTFLANHKDAIASLDFIVVPTIGFKLLYCLVILDHSRRKILWTAVSAHPTSGWTARQITEAFPWESGPKYLIRDNDGIFGLVYRRRLEAMGIRDRPISLRSPWQNGYCERVIGTIRRECLDHLIILDEAHLRRVVKTFADYYNSVRTHQSLEKDAPVPRSIQPYGAIKSVPWLGGLHHQYLRM